MYEGEGGGMRSLLHPVITWRKMPEESLAHGATRLPNPGLECCVAKFQQESASSPPMKLPMSFFGQGSGREEVLLFLWRRRHVCSPNS